MTNFWYWFILAILVYVFARLIGWIWSLISYHLIRPFVCRWRHQSFNKSRCPYLKCKQWRNCPYYDQTEDK